jgi:YegS/Rv2252/BmrU family lipid kinase
MNFLVIINPNSGKRKSISVFKKYLKPSLENNFFRYEIKTTTHSGHAKQIIESINLLNFNAILVLGGDGTMHEVINGLLKRKDKINLPIGNIPTGSGNSLLYDLGKFDVKDSINIILKNKIRKIDILELSTLNEKIYSMNLIGWGMGNDIGFRAEKMRWLGPMRYNIASLIEILKYRGRQATIKIDSIEYKDSYALITICNTIHVGKGMKMAPNASLNDKKMDIIMIKDNFSKLELLKLFPQIFSGNHVKNKKVTYVQAETFSLKTLKNDILNIDGEIKGETPIKIRVIPKCIKLLN